MSAPLVAGMAALVRQFFTDQGHEPSAALLKAAMHHNGTCVLDVVSPCVTFNNHESSTKSYKYAKDHGMALHDIDFIEHVEPQAPVDIPAGVPTSLQDIINSICKHTGVDLPIDHPVWFIYLTP